MKGMINMAKTEPRTLSGFMELLPNEQILFNQMRETIEDTYKKFGFLPLDTPVIELSEVLLAKAGGETEKQIYRFNKGDLPFGILRSAPFFGAEWFVTPDKPFSCCGSLCGIPFPALWIWSALVCGRTHSVEQRI